MRSELREEHPSGLVYSVYIYMYNYGPLCVIVNQTMVSKTAVSGKTVVAHRTPIIPAERKTAQRILLRCRCNVFAALFTQHELLGRYPRETRPFQDRIYRNDTSNFTNRKKIIYFTQSRKFSSIEVNFHLLI